MKEDFEKMLEIDRKLMCYKITPKQAIAELSTLKHNTLSFDMMKKCNMRIRNLKEN